MYTIEQLKIYEHEYNVKVNYKFLCCHIQRLRFDIKEHGLIDKSLDYILTKLRDNVDNLERDLSKGEYFNIDNGLALHVLKRKPSQQHLDQINRGYIDSLYRDIEDIKYDLITLSFNEKVVFRYKSHSLIVIDKHGSSSFLPTVVFSWNKCNDDEHREKSKLCHDSSFINWRKKIKAL